MKPADQPAPPRQQARFVAVALIVGALTGVFGGPECRAAGVRGQHAGTEEVAEADRSRP
jgi:hypothetical protein